MTKTCTRCNKTKDESEFPFNGIRRHSWCKECHRENVREKYQANRDWVNTFKTKCCRCGYKKNKSALEFHHPNDDKEFTINTLARRALANKQRLLNEINKCEVLCANCHREEHNPQLNMGE